MTIASTPFTFPGDTAMIERDREDDWKIVQYEVQKRFGPLARCINDSLLNFANIQQSSAKDPKAVFIGNSYWKIVPELEEFCDRMTPGYRLDVYKVLHLSSLIVSYRTVVIIFAEERHLMFWAMRP